ncbi:MAG: MBL fold metallo-hydrolase [Alphaproteobacteria bacterium]|nr:MBL fold metallo-hydrolase [Alphaproteobacteria bacterium]
MGGLGWRLVRRCFDAFAALLLLAASAGGAFAQCLPMVQADPWVIPAALPEDGDVRLSYLGHSSFLIESAGGAAVVTDYNGVHRAPFAPDIVTMNNAHSTHFSDVIEPGVAHALRGWGEGGTIAEHDVTFKDIHIRNVPTNVREFGGTRYNSNSIFIFELADLCIAHLGHLHHTLSEQHLRELGLIDVLLVPIDGVYTMAQELMVEVIQQISPSIVIPMHYFSRFGVERFIGLMRGRYEAVYSNTPTIVFSRLRLPYKKIVVLAGGGGPVFGDDE